MALLFYSTERDVKIGVLLQATRFVLRKVMPRSGPSYPFDKEWRLRVEAAMRVQKLSRSDMARAIKASRSVVTNILNGVVQQSPYVPDIHRVLGWTPPAPATDGPPVSDDELKALELYRALSDRGRAAWSERGQAILERELEAANESLAKSSDVTSPGKPPTRGSQR